MTTKWPVDKKLVKVCRHGVESLRTQWVGMAEVYIVSVLETLNPVSGWRENVSIWGIFYAKKTYFLWFYFYFLCLQE